MVCNVPLDLRKPVKWIMELALGRRYMHGKADWGLASLAASHHMYRCARGKALHVPWGRVQCLVPNIFLGNDNLRKTASFRSKRKTIRKAAFFHHTLNS